MKKPVFLIFLFLFNCHSFGQVPVYSGKYNPGLTIGLGGGIDFGGFGTRLGFLASEKLSIFGALGYNLVETGYNFGLQFRMAPNSQYCPFLGAMYGYNAVIKVIGSPRQSATYYGISMTAGTEYWFRRKPQFISFGIILPVKSRKFREDYGALNHNSNIVNYNNILPFGISIGYHFLLKV